MNNINKNTSKDRKEETLRTLIEMYTECDHYLTHEFFPVWGLDKKCTQDSFKKMLTEMDFILEGNKNPFFE